jgi:hypothetical protein
MKLPMPEHAEGMKARVISALDPQSRSTALASVLTPQDGFFPSTFPFLPIAPTLPLPAWWQH